MKRLFGIILVALFTFTAVHISGHPRDMDIGIFFNGAEITEAVGAPLIIDGRTYVPVRAFAEALGYDVSWDGETGSVFVGVHPDDIEGLFAAAVLDAMVVCESDIYPLVEITPESPLVTWDDEGRVLMLTYHRFPESYVAGEEFTLVFGPVWTFTDREIIEWFRENSEGVTDWELRFKQLIGLPPWRAHTHFSALWVNPEDITRPGYAWQLSDTIGATSFAVQPEPEWKEWFNSNIIWSYFEFVHCPKQRRCAF